METCSENTKPRTKKTFSAVGCVDSTLRHFFSCSKHALIVAHHTAWLKCWCTLRLIRMVIHVCDLIVCFLPFFPHLVSFRVFLLSLLLLLEPGPVPLPLPCGFHRGNIPLALRQMRSLALWPITRLSQAEEKVKTRNGTDDQGRQRGHWTKCWCTGTTTCCVCLAKIVAQRFLACWWVRVVGCTLCPRLVVPLCLFGHISLARLGRQDGGKKPSAGEAVVAAWGHTLAHHTAPHRTATTTIQSGEAPF